MSSDTPRTDAAERTLYDHVNKRFQVVSIDIARTLECELTAAKARIAELEAQAKADAEDAFIKGLEAAAAIASNHAGVCTSNGYGEKARTASTISDIILAAIDEARGRGNG